MLHVGKRLSLGVLAAFILLANPSWAALPLDSISDKQLRSDLRQTALNISFGKSMRAMIDANALGWSVFHRGRNDVTRELSYALALQGLAEATLQMEREALWHWAAAQTLRPELNADLLGTYDEVVGLFESSPMRSQESAIPWLRQRGEFLDPGEGVSVPVARTKQGFQVPSKKRTALNGSSVTVSFLVDPEGRAHTPSILQGESQPLVVFTVLQSLLAWEFEPAQRDGKLGWSLAARTFSFR